MHNQAEAERRLRILIFWEKHGDEATKEAFRVSRRTLYRWQEVLRRGEGKIVALDKKSTAPTRKNVRRIPPELSERIIALRTEHHRLGKRKLTPILKSEGLSISEPYVGRVLADLKKRGLLPRYKTVRVNARSGRMHERVRTVQPKIRRPKEKKRGMEIDTIVRFIGSTKRYILTAIDVERRFAFAAAYTNHSSATATDFLGKLIAVTPFPVTEIQTDNGSEFAHLFHDACGKLSIRHYHTYPRCPKMNSTVERFNRTLSEEFIQHHLQLLKGDIVAFNEKLIDYLLWYNNERPHESLSLKSPLQCIVQTLSAEECQMWRSCTSS
ncbi:MAG: DDE-type integrase/transposase/recombinase [Patescibacteria group bacterium]|nr:DDE-type integrase/transposase/recombinase [Patescibacteria group bacterium]